MMAVRDATKFAVFLLTANAGTACASAARIPVEAAGSGPHGYVEADVRFIHGMIPHHAQALTMTDLVADRTDSEAMHRLARRIEVSQKDEIAIMERWLERRGETVPKGHHHGPLMPGMLTEENLARLGQSTGDGFDRLFLELMIRHHEGALVMVADLFSSGGGQEAEIFQFASHVDADQRAEIARMRGMLNTPLQEGNE
jgi:uncharacterized protein (DUF305 family)